MRTFVRVYDDSSVDGGMPGNVFSVDVEAPDSKLFESDLTLSNRDKAFIKGAECGLDTSNRIIAERCHLRDRSFRGLLIKKNVDNLLKVFLPGNGVIRMDTVNKTNERNK